MENVFSPKLFSVLHKGYSKKMFQERTKKLFALKKSEKNNQKHIQSLSKDLISEENFNKFKSQKSYHTNTESQTHQKAQSTVINGPNDNNIKEVQDKTIKELNDIIIKHYNKFIECQNKNLLMSIRYDYCFKRTFRKKS